MPQGWNIGTKKEVEPAKIRELIFRKDKKTKKDTTSILEEQSKGKRKFDPRKPDDRELTSERVPLLLNTIKEKLPTACSLLSIEYGTERGILPLGMHEEALEFMADKNIENVPVEEVVPLFLENCQMTTTQVAEVEKSTRGQSTNNNWKEQRLGRVTASKFHTVAAKAESLMKHEENGR